MDDRPYLGELEQTILWAVLRLEGDAYGAALAVELEDRVGRTVTPGAMYATLDRLEAKGLIASELADPVPGRGGRPRKMLSVTEAGREALAAARSEWQRLWEGLDPAPGV